MKLMIELPDDGWFEKGCGIKPEHNQICVIIYATAYRTPEIAQYIDRPYRMAKGRKPDQGFFIDVGGVWYENAVGASEINEGYINWGIVAKWKPLVLPEEDDARAKKATREILLGEGNDDEFIWDDETAWKEREGIDE